MKTAPNPAQLDWRTVAAERDAGAKLDAELVSCRRDRRPRGDVLAVPSWMVPVTRASIAAKRTAALLEKLALVPEPRIAA